MALGAVLVGTSLVAVAASCSNSNIKSKLSKQLAQTKDQNNFFVVYEIENYDKLSNENKKSLENLEFGVSIIDKDGKNPVNIKVNGIQKDGKVYVKLPRKPEVGEKLVVVPSKNVLQTAGLVLNADNLHYQTVDFETKSDQKIQQQTKIKAIDYEKATKDENYVKQITLDNLEKYINNDYEYLNAENKTLDYKDHAFVQKFLNEIDDLAEKVESNDVDLKDKQIYEKIIVGLRWLLAEKNDETKNEALELFKNYFTTIIKATKVNDKVHYDSYFINKFYSLMSNLFEEHDLEPSVQIEANKVHIVKKDKDLIKDKTVTATFNLYNGFDWPTLLKDIVFKEYKKDSKGQVEQKDGKPIETDKVIEDPVVMRLQIAEYPKDWKTDQKNPEKYTYVDFKKSDVLKSPKLVFTKVFNLDKEQKYHINNVMFSHKLIPNLLKAFNIEEKVNDNDINKKLSEKIKSNLTLVDEKTQKNLNSDYIPLSLTPSTNK
ncbi:MBA family surface membrane protein [Ureaplasma urealyticum]